MIGKVFASAFVLVLGYYLTMRGIPGSFVRVGRLLGFRMRLTPLTAKRVQRFKGMRRGYYSFVALATLFVCCLFLEVLVNGKPIYMRFGDRIALPALRDLGNTWVPFDFWSDFDRSSDFGLDGDGMLDYRAFSRWIEDPDAMLERSREAKEREREKLRAEFADVRQEVEELRADGEEPEDFLLEELASASEEEERIASEIGALVTRRDAFASGSGTVIWPIYEHGWRETRLDLPGVAPFPPAWQRHGVAELQAVSLLDAPLGTDPSGVDIVPQLLYGFRISMGFALFVLVCGYAFGILVGAVMGYFGGWIDIGVQRIIEIWGSIPFLYTMMILADMTVPGFWMLATMLVILSAWLGITYLIRGEFYREKARDYVQAAIGTGVSDLVILIKHILPNSLVPVIATAPFAFVAYINSLVSLDYLGFGLPPGTPSWGGMLRNGREFLTTEPHLVLIPVCTLAVCLLLIVLVGEAVREAFDPKVYSRLR